ncbi:binding--dependent transport system inner membrane component family protein [Candidatus Phytoplasma oryzae]|uniref:Binding--dependent transport system inner membrane component family protein n=1 Tax=Candidatus Phytoplasma oryzae TaxID=203274 RepID=A0A139JR70_9MOLU|nr:ABC transporter permease [Candidatus Phytoplasma oryzae]KXT29246.1 binding--dependent transport system inner membrane component family protein [Candidatus Phytoplasma oryzae]KXT29350.1 binding--dependent transport system inner membrane component family protein [Candidatus Phytoplasma oryzae]RAM57902.1 spermidine/putrescine ABC transporter permease [Candidatus Phytoplasma oryzae]
MISSKKSKFNIFLFLPYFFIILFLVLIPIFITFFDSIQKYNNKNLFKIFLTFEYYRNFYSNITFVYVLLRSISISIIATFFIIILTYPLAYIVSRMNILTQSILILLINGTIWINIILKTQALVQIFSLIEKFFSIRLLESNTAMFIGFIYLFFPYMFLSIYISISKIDSNLIDSAKDLGANEKQIFKKIILPLSLPGLMTGISLVILQIVTNIVVPKYLGPTTVIVISELIENKVFLNGDIKSACAIAVNLSLLMFCILAFFKRNHYNSHEFNDEK